MMKLLENGEILNCNLTPEDVSLMYETSRPCIECRECGMVEKIVKESPEFPPIAPGLELHMDILILRNKKQIQHMLISCDDNTSYGHAIKLQNKKGAQVFKAIKKVVTFYKGNKLKVEKIHTDSEKVFGSIETKLNEEEIQLEVKPVGKHERKVERYIREVRKKLRLLKKKVKIPFSILPFAIEDIVNRMNFLPNKRTGVRTPRSIVCKKKLDWKTDIKYPFGTIVVAHNPNHKVDESSADVAMVVGTTPNSKGGLKVWKFQDPDGVICARHQMEKITPTNDIIRSLEQLKQFEEEALEWNFASSTDNEDDDNQTHAPIETNSDIITEVTCERNDVDVDESFQEDDFITSEETLPISTSTSTSTSRNLRPLKPRTFAPRYSNMVCGITVKRAIQRYKILAEKAFFDEMNQLIVKKQCLKPVHSLRGLEGAKIIYGFMFATEKHDAVGKFIKLKMRLVALGNLLNIITKIYNGSPTVNGETVMFLLGIAAIQNLMISVVDIPGAYLNADLKECYVLVLDAELSEYLIRMFPEYECFRQPNGTILMRVDKALYGLRESSHLWYETLTNVLIKYGYQRIEEDKSLFYKTDGNDRSYLTIHVDDIMHVYTNIFMHQELIQILTNEFGDKPTEDSIYPLTYLGLSIDRAASGDIYVSMPNFTNKILDMYNDVDYIARTPATQSLIDEPSESEDSVNRTEYLSKLMTLYYLARKCRPDILFPLSILTTRSQNPKESDMEKLNRVIAYLKWNPNKGILLRHNPDEMKLFVYVDASFNIHLDSKSHTGIGISIGDNSDFIFTKSTKQSCISGSSTESELIGLTEALKYCNWFSRLANSLDVNLILPTIIYQDNQSAIQLATIDTINTTKARFMNLRINLIRDQLAKDNIMLEYLPSGKMKVDMLTKVIVGENFQNLMNKIVH